MRSALALTAALAIAVPVVAEAAFTASPSASMSVTSATLQPPTGVSASVTACTPLLSRRVTVTWTATASTFATGYDVLRATTSGGPYTLVGTANGRATTSYEDTTVAASTTYHFIVRSSKLSWRSVNSNRASVTTPAAACL